MYMVEEKALRNSLALSSLSGEFCARQYFRTCFHDLLYLTSASSRKSSTIQAPLASICTTPTLVLALGLMWL